jgi:NAD-dependent deacetylase sirtuin 4
MAAPPAAAAAAAGRAILQHLRGASNILFLTGAGVSTQSGIPDYRSPERPAYTPLQHREFVHSEQLRQRYWARSMVGWPRMRDAAPNAAHHALAALQRAGLCAALITQNVDTLHAKAGHGGELLELHGRLFAVECLACGSAAPPLCRNDLQRSMEASNAPWVARHAAAAVERPDGDMELPQESYASFAQPRCARCGGATLKPMVTFFGGTVPPQTVQRSLALAAAADALVVCGSTCSTFSAFRLLKSLAERGRPVVVVRRGGGAARGDALATLLVEEEVGSVMQGVLQALGGKEGRGQRVVAL